MKIPERCHIFIGDHCFLKWSKFILHNYQGTYTLEKLAYPSNNTFHPCSPKENYNEFENKIFPCMRATFFIIFPFSNFYAPDIFSPLFFSHSRTLSTSLGKWSWTAVNQVRSNHAGKKTLGKKEVQSDISLGLWRDSHFYWDHWHTFEIFLSSRILISNLSLPSNSPHPNQHILGPWIFFSLSFNMFHGADI